MAWLDYVLLLDMAVVKLNLLIVDNWLGRCRIALMLLRRERMNSMLRSIVLNLI